MPPILTLSANDYRRLAEVVRVLAQSGARPALTRLGLLRGGSGGKAGNLEEMAEAVVVALERLGPTFVKLGQILATRSDLLSPELTERLARLHDRAAPLPFAELRDQLTQDLGAPPEEVFAAFSPEPLASASIAQVHAAQLRSGEEVVIKMRRPASKPSWRPIYAFCSRPRAPWSGVFQRSLATSRRGWSRSCAMR